MGEIYIKFLVKLRNSSVVAYRIDSIEDNKCILVRVDGNKHSRISTIETKTSIIFRKIADNLEAVGTANEILVNYRDL